MLLPAHDRRPVREFPEPDDAMATTDITLCVTDVVMRVAQADGESYFRPMIGDLPGEYQTVMMSFVRLIQGCWAEDVSLRPTSRRLLRLMKRLNPFQSVSCLYTDHFRFPSTDISECSISWTSIFAVEFCSVKLGQRFDSSTFQHGQIMLMVMSLL